MLLTDDIVGKNYFNPPYRFVVGNNNEIIHIVDDPVIAYDIYYSLVEMEEGLYLKDSFGKEAVEFCRKQAEKF